jgi:hypothetical protein
MRKNGDDNGINDRVFEIVQYTNCAQLIIFSGIWYD